MTERSYFWGGTTVGDATAAPYDATEFCRVYRILLNADRTKQGVIAGYDNELAVTAGASSVNVASGALFGAGKLYENTAALNLPMDLPSAGHYRIDTIVIQQDDTAQTSRAYVHKNAAEDAVAEAPTQAGAIWEITLGTANITSAGVVTVTDQRYMLRSPGGAGAEYKQNPGDDAVQTASAWNDITAAGCSVTLTAGKWLVFGSAQVQGGTSAGNRHLRVYDSTSSAQVLLGSVYLDAAGAYIQSIHTRPTVYAPTATCTLKLQYYALGTDDNVYGGTGTGLDREACGIVAIRVTD